MQKITYTLAQIAELTGATLEGNADCTIQGIASLEKAIPGQISFLVNSRYQLVASGRYEKFLPTTKASAVLLSPLHAEDCPVDKLIIDDPYQGYLKLAALFAIKASPKPGIHKTAIIGTDSKIAASVSIGANCVIGNHCEIGEGTVIGPNTIIGDYTTIGMNGDIEANVTLYDQVNIGDRCMIQSGAIIGSEGFGMIRDSEGWKKIPHLGGVLIGHNVEIGANTTIARGAIDDTVLEDGVKLDNLIQVAHGVVIGKNTVIAGCVGIAGSARIGRNCMIGGMTGISDNIVIGDNVIFTGMSQVTKSITKPGIYSSGTSILPQKAWHKNIARLHNLDDIARKLRKLEKETNE
ncbi:MAG: UDP-3-O-(3-hydroxymyristoyl)glucosamine N-acyltransferase [Gammaproteobacteria bacterium]|nr:UDP-3-O-(3-hydroxymyristoyl)glucosamine N-acyltransferase [Gammaproteobacteria bacterium]